MICIVKHRERSKKALQKPWRSATASHSPSTHGNIAGFTNHGGDIAIPSSHWAWKETINAQQWGDAHKTTPTHSTSPGARNLWGSDNKGKKSSQALSSPYTTCTNTHFQDITFRSKSLRERKIAPPGKAHTWDKHTSLSKVRAQVPHPLEGTSLVQTRHKESPWQTRMLLSIIL